MADEGDAMKIVVVAAAGFDRATVPTPVIGDTA
jgi:hypothetical protein